MLTDYGYRCTVPDRRDAKAFHAYGSACAGKLGPEQDRVLVTTVAKASARGLKQHSCYKPDPIDIRPIRGQD